jgi:hypothetical protein
VTLVDRQALLTKYHGAEAFTPPSVHDALSDFDAALAHDPSVSSDPFIAELERRSKGVA